MDQGQEIELSLTAPRRARSSEAGLAAVPAWRVYASAPQQEIRRYVSRSAIVAHGLYNSRPIYGLSEEEERAY